MPNQSTQNPSVAATGQSLVAVEIRHGKPMVSSLTIAELFSRRHDNVLSAIAKVAEAKPHLLIRKEMSKDGRGRERPVFWLDEKAALTVMPFIGGKHAMDGQEKLVDAYLAYHRQAESRKEPDWQKVRVDSIVSFKMQNATLKDMRETHGKTTEAKHYMCEAKLIGYVMTGKFSGIDRNLLSAGDLSRIAELQRINAMLIAQDMPYQERKAILLDRAVKKLAA